MKTDRRAAVFALALMMAGLAGACRQDMHDQAKYEPFEASELFPEGTSSRLPVAGTVARGDLREGALYRATDAAGQPVGTLPVPLTRELLERGRGRYEAFCSPCHGRAGDGQGMVVQRGFKRPASFHEPRLRAAAVGYFYDVVSNGFGQMSSYAAQIAPADRWAIVAYVRALQLSRQAPAELLSAAERQRLAAAAAGEAGGGSGGTPPGETAGQEHAQ